ncbi:uncharacterized protein LOC114269718 [Camellia sinensis]|uniref:uncharacterized protein LOC114269718 n=1 Tax=Camellia sinensis TaxID=4442 RepID=UPI001036A95A|nr:uncharacterized protein LOC114269718 [Camellia sinensis]
MTNSEVDHLDDGYRWRKYGQKAVKNCPLPRGFPIWLKNIPGINNLASPSPIRRFIGDLLMVSLAFCLFAQEKVDIAVIEAGLGGARDATNTISSSGLVASVITTGFLIAIMATNACY